MEWFSNLSKTVQLVLVGAGIFGAVAVIAGIVYILKG